MVRQMDFVMERQMVRRLVKQMEKLRHLDFDLVIQTVRLMG